MATRPEDEVFGTFTDPRDANAIAANAGTVAEQVAALLGSEAQRAFHEEITGRLRERRERVSIADRPDVVRFDVGRVRGPQVPVVTKQLLVRAPEDTTVQLLQTRSFSGPSTPIPELPELVVFEKDVSVDEIARVADDVRGRGSEASVNYVTPLRVVVKGRGGPEEATVRLTAEEAPGGDAVCVAVIDTGIVPKVVNGEPSRDDGWLKDVDRRGGTAEDPLNVFPVGNPDGFLDFAAGHGTFVAGVVRQVAPKARLAIYRAVDSDGIGSEVEVARAIIEAVKDGADIVNLSLGAQTLDDQPLLAIEMALEWVAEQNPDVLVVAAAGNDGNSRPSWPAASPRVTAVGSLTARMRPSVWSNRGSWVDCSCVGEGIVSTYVPGKESRELDPDAPDTWDKNAWAVWSGTSFTAPQVAGAVARTMRSGGQSLTPRAALRELLRGRRRLAGFGAVLHLLPGTGARS